MTGSNPVDRGKPGSEIHALSDPKGLPLAVGISAANTPERWWSRTAGMSCRRGVTADFLDLSLEGVLRA